MEEYIKNITPFVQEMLRLTKERAVQWEKTADGTYRCVAEYEGVSLEISSFYNVLVKDTVSIQLYSDEKKIFSYSRDLLDKHPEFDILLRNLFDEVEAANLEKVTNKFSTLVKAFTKNQK